MRKGQFIAFILLSNSLTTYFEFLQNHFLILGESYSWLRAVQASMILAVLLELSALITVSIILLMAKIHNREKRLKDFSFASGFNILAGIVLLDFHINGILGNLPLVRSIL